MDHNSDTIVTRTARERIEDSQLAKCVELVSALDAKICVTQIELAKESGTGQNELCHSLEMKNDEKVHTLATLQEKVGYAVGVTQLGGRGV